MGEAKASLPRMGKGVLIAFGLSWGVVINDYNLRVYFREIDTLLAISYIVHLHLCHLGYLVSLAL
jgi:hypothetical protein